MRKKYERLNSDDRRQQILDAALAIAKKQGYKKATQIYISRKLKISPALTMHYFKTMKKLRREIMDVAIEREDLLIIAQGIIEKEIDPKKLSKLLIKKVIKYLMKGE